MKIKLAEVQLAIQEKEQELRDVYALRSRSLTNTYRIDKDTKDEELYSLPHQESVEDLTSQADKLEEDILTLKSILGKANNSTIIDYGNMTLQEGIIKIKAMRQSLQNVKYLADLKETKRVIDDQTTINGTVKGYIESIRPSYDTQLFKEKYESLKKSITKLEVAITSANYTTEVDLADNIIN